MIDWPTAGCGHLTAGVCAACAPLLLPGHRCPGCVTVNVTVPIEEALRRVAEILREFAEKESGPVRERLSQIAEVVDGSR